MDDGDNQDGVLQYRRRNLPHWELPGSTYFITFRLREAHLSAKDIVSVLGCIKEGDGVYYDLFAATVMPTHVHVVLRPIAGVSLARVTKGIKGVAAKEVNARRGTRGALWQDESYDRIMRDDKEMAEKIEYIFNNAVRRGLCEDGWDYPGLFLKGGKE